MTSRVCRALLALVLFLGAGSLMLGSARADASQAAAKPVLVGIGQVTPQIPDFNDTSKTMTFSGQLRNTGTTALKNVRLELQRTEVTARSKMGSATGDGDYTVLNKTRQDFPELAPGATLPWSLAPTETVLFGTKKPDAGVYAIDVDAFDTETGDFLGGQRTYVVWKPASLYGAKPARVALLWPVVGQPGITGEKTPNAAAAPIITDPVTETQYRKGGRLDDILQYGQQFPVNWILDPDVLYTANQLSSGYFVDVNGTGKLQGADGSNAKYWYEAAHAYFTSPQTQNCWNLPYSDPDLTTLAHLTAGQDLLGPATHLQAGTAGACRQPQTIAWPADGQADGTTLKAVHDAKIDDQVTLLSSNVVSSWPSAHVSVPESPSTVVYDSYMSSIFTTPAADSQPSLNNAGVLAGQQWLAQTALLDRDATDRILVVAPPRDFDPSPALTAAIGAAEKVSPADRWVGLEDLGKVLSQKPAAAPASPLAQKISTQNLSTDIVKTTSDGQKLYSALHTIMAPSHDKDDAVPFRPVAAWWRTHGGDSTFSATVYATVVNEHGLVKIDAQSLPLTLSGKSGSVPVTIVNSTNSTVRVYLRAHSSHSVQLKVADDQGLQIVGSGQRLTVRIRVQGEGNGQHVQLDATLFTCADVNTDCKYYPNYPGDLYNKIDNNGHAQITVSVSRIGIIALGLMIGSGVLLVVLIGLRVYRAKRAHHAPAQDTMAS